MHRLIGCLAHQELSKCSPGSGEAFLAERYNLLGLTGPFADGADAFRDPGDTVIRRDTACPVLQESQRSGSGLLASPSSVGNGQRTSRLSDVPLPIRTKFSWRCSSDSSVPSQARQDRFFVITP